MTEDSPCADALRQALTEQTSLLTGPQLGPTVTVRVRRALTVAGELLDRDEDDPGVREVVSRALAWTAETVGAHQRLPSGYAATRVLACGRSPLLRLVDELDLLGLTLDHAYDAVARDDADHLRHQLDVLVERFAAETEPAHLTGRPAPGEPSAVDPQTAGSAGAEVGDDGIPRVPVPEQPAPPRGHPHPQPDQEDRP